MTVPTPVSLSTVLLPMADEAARLSKHAEGTHAVIVRAVSAVPNRSSSAETTSIGDLPGRRHAHRLANAEGTGVGNDGGSRVGKGTDTEPDGLA